MASPRRAISALARCAPSAQPPHQLRLSSLLLAKPAQPLPPGEREIPSVRSYAKALPRTRWCKEKRAELLAPPVHSSIKSTQPAEATACAAIAETKAAR